MRQFDLVDNSVRLVLKGNVLAVLAEAPLNTVSGAIYNGGFKKTKAILNVQVPDEYGDRRLHEDPLKFVEESSKKLALMGDFVGMITAANVEKFSLVRKQEDDFGVAVVATAGCSHAESAGEKIELEQIEGTINVIVVIDGNPTQSCLVAALATAVEAKAAAVRDLDVRSRYSGDAATGTITDSVVVAATTHGKAINYGGPASQLGQAIGYCTRKAVKDAITNQGECLPHRSVSARLRERHLPIEKIASELSKMKGLRANEKTLAKNLTRMLRNDPVFAAAVMAAIELDEDVKGELTPPEFGKTASLSRRFGALLSNVGEPTLNEAERGNAVDLPPFLKQVLMGRLKEALSEGETESLK
jgi:iron complex transport system ATP-binding protein